MIETLHTTCCIIHVSTPSAASFTLMEAGISGLSPLNLGGSLARFCKIINHNITKFLYLTHYYVNMLCFLK